MNQKSKLIIGGAIGVFGIGAAIVLTLLLFWFNRYSYSETKIGDNTFPVRTSRITGESEVNIMGNWTKSGGAAQPSEPTSSSTTFPLSAEDLRRLDGRAGTSVFSDRTLHYMLQCSIYN